MSGAAHRVAPDDDRFDHLPVHRLDVGDVGISGSVMMVAGFEFTRITL